MIQLDELGESKLKETLEKVEEGRLDPSLRKTNTAPGSMSVYKRGEKEDANQS